MAFQIFLGIIFTLVFLFIILPVSLFLIFQKWFWKIIVYGFLGLALIASLIFSIYYSPNSKVDNRSNRITTSKSTNKSKLINSRILNNSFDKYSSAHNLFGEEEESREIRKVCFGDLNGDQKDDGVVLYETVPKGGNALSHQMAVFLNLGDSLKYFRSKPIGRRGTRLFNNCSVENGMLKIKTFDYTEDDPNCCPSDSGLIISKIFKTEIEFETEEIPR